MDIFKHLKSFFGMIWSYIHSSSEKISDIGLEQIKNAQNDLSNLKEQLTELWGFSEAQKKLWLLKSPLYLVK